MHGRRCTRNAAVPLNIGMIDRPHTFGQKKTKKHPKIERRLPVVHPTATSLTSPSFSVCAAGQTTRLSSTANINSDPFFEHSTRFVLQSPLRSPTAVSRHPEGRLGGLAKPDPRVPVVEHGVVLALQNENTVAERCSRGSGNKHAQQKESNRTEQNRRDGGRWQSLSTGRVSDGN